MVSLSNHPDGIGTFPSLPLFLLDNFSRLRLISLTLANLYILGPE